MGNEELKAIRHRIGNSLFKMGRQSGKTQLAKDLKHLMEQAEQVQELEDQIQRLDKIMWNNFARTKHYREALEKIQNKFVTAHCFDFIPIDIALEIRQIVNEALEVTN